MTKTLLLILIVATLAAPVVPTGARAAERREQAAALHRLAVEALRVNTVEHRRVAIQRLEQATLLDPGNPEYELALARAYYAAGFLKQARGRFERVARIAPDDADGHFGLGQVWRRDWLKYLERASLARAIDGFSAAARLEPDSPDPWLELVPLLIERGDLGAARAAAGHALASGRRRAEATLAWAGASWRLGDVRGADSAFALALPALPGVARERFDDIAPVASERDTFALHRLAPHDQVEFVRRFWREHDPDLATRENEARLEYWARVTQAYFLFFNPRLGEWDERGEVYVRYGPPDSTAYNPVNERLSVSFGTGPPFPANVLVWDYRGLGMRVAMHDRLLSERYRLPMSTTRDMDPTPNPDSLSRMQDVLPLRGGRGVFRALPPGVRRLPVEGAIARFEGATGGERLLAQLATPGSPADTLFAEWVVLDSASTREVARGSRALVSSACDPAALRVAEFAAELEPGAYVAGISVHDGRGGRGIWRSPVSVAGARAGVRLSDIVVSCGTPDVSPADGGPPVIRIEPNPASRVGPGDPLTAYFEIYGLSPEAGGLARFEYLYTVRAKRDPRIWLQRVLQPRSQPPPLSTRREAENAGSLRRQFVSVPVHELPDGEYRLDIQVRDLVAGTETKGSVPFVKGSGEIR